MLQRRLFTYKLAAPEEVAITHTRETPIASLMGSPNTKVNMGMMRTPPPKPKTDPKSPANKPPNAISKKSDI
jgi:hypothetical protein